MIFSEHFAENLLILLQTVANDGALNFVQFFSGPLCVSFARILSFFHSPFYKTLCGKSCLFTIAETAAINLSDLQLSKKINAWRLKTKTF